MSWRKKRNRKVDFVREKVFPFSLRKTSDLSGQSGRGIAGERRRNAVFHYCSFQMRNAVGLQNVSAAVAEMRELLAPLLRLSCCNRKHLILKPLTRRHMYLFYCGS